MAGLDAAALPDRARVVIIGGGVAGCSLAYHLTKLGWSDVVLLERGELTSGSTWHAAGLCTQFNSSFNLMKLLMTSLDLYESLEAETGQPTGLKRVGSVRLGTTPDRIDEFKQRRAMAGVLGLPFEIVGPKQVRELLPYISTEGVRGAAHLPTDGHVDPSSVTHSLAAGARSGGARIFRATPVTRIERTSGGEWLVETPYGRVEAEIVVNAAGMWATQIARMVGVELPIVPLEHHYVVTERIPIVAELREEPPVLRDPERNFYCRAEAGGLLVGPFEHDARPWAVDGIPVEFGQQLLPPNLPAIEAVLEAAAERVPVFGETGIRTVVNGPDGYTPDGRCLMGEVPGLRNFHVLAGFSIFGIVFSGGAGRYAAEWIVHGQPSDNMWDVDVRRFGDYGARRPFLVAKAQEVYRREYAIHYPHEELPDGRPLKMTPLYERLKAKGAVYGFRFGWERPVWFARDGMQPVDEHTFRVPNWHEAVGEECRAVRTRVGVLDQTSFAKYEISGPGARAFLDRLCANALPQEAGRIRLTQMLTQAGGIECDVTVTMLAADLFYVVSAAATETHDLAWIQRHVPEDGSVVIDNVTGRYGVLTIAGPRSRELLQRLTTADLSNDGFRFLACREIAVGAAPVRALRISYVGELGWELHHPLEYQLHLYELIEKAGRDLGLVDFGYHALDSMRLEKGYRLWGADMSNAFSPLEAGLDPFVKLDKGDFIGRDGLIARHANGVEQKLACLAIPDGLGLPYEFEPVFHDGECVSYLMCGGYGHVVETSIGFSYLPVALCVPGTRLEVEILGERLAATVVEEPLYDPEGAKLRT